MRIALVLALATAALSGRAQPLGDWLVAGSGGGIYTAIAGAGLLLFCADDGAVEADVGPYGRVPGATYTLRFEAEGREVLQLLARVGPATAVTVRGEDAETLVAFLHDVPVITVSMAPAGLRLPGGPVRFTLPTLGFGAALAELPCGAS